MSGTTTGACARATVAASVSGGGAAGGSKPLPPSLTTTRMNASAIATLTVMVAPSAASGCSVALVTSSDTRSSSESSCEATAGWSAASSRSARRAAAAAAAREWSAARPRRSSRVHERQVSVGAGDGEHLHHAVRRLEQSQREALALCEPVGLEQELQARGVDELHRPEIDFELRRPGGKRIVAGLHEPAHGRDVELAADTDGRGTSVAGHLDVKGWRRRGHRWRSRLRQVRGERLRLADGAGQGSEIGRAG